MPAADRRPLGVTLIALVLALDGWAVFLGALARSDLASPDLGQLLLGLVIAIMLQLLAYGLWRLQWWAWLATLVLASVSAFGSLLSITRQPSDLGTLGSLLIVSVILAYLARPAVRHAFRHRTTGA